MTGFTQNGKIGAFEIKCLQCGRIVTVQSGSRGQDEIWLSGSGQIEVDSVWINCDCGNEVEIE